MARDYARNQRGSRNSSNETTGPAGIVWLLFGILMGLIIAGIFYLKNQNTHPTPLQVKTTTAANTPTQNAKSTQASPDNLQAQFDFYDVLPSQKVVGPSGDEDTSTINNQNNSVTNPTTQQPTTTTAQQQTTTQQATTQPQLASSNTTTPTAGNNATTTNTTPTPTPSTPTSSQTTPQLAPVTQLTTPPPAQTPAIKSTSTTHTATTTTPPHTTTPSNKSTAKAPTSTSPTNNTSTNNNAQDYLLQIATFSKFTDADQLKAQLSLSGYEVNITQIQRNGKPLERVWIGPFHSVEQAKSTQKLLQSNQINSILLKSS